MENHKNISSLLNAINLKNLQQYNDFQILKYENHSDLIPYQTISRKCNFFQIFFSKEYDAHITIDDNCFSLKNKPLISFLPPLQTLSVDIKNVQTISTSYMIAFEASFLNNIWTDFDIQHKFPYFNLNYSPIYFLEKNHINYEVIFEKMHQLFSFSSEENLEIIRSYLYILLYESKKSFFNGTIKNNLRSRYQKIAFSFESLIRNYSNSRNSLDFYANKLNISTVYLSECIKKSTNKTAKQIINEYTILEATTLLIQTTDTIDEIAYKLGFSATSNFINFFKKHTSYTPYNYRKNQKT